MDPILRLDGLGQNPHSERYRVESSEGYFSLSHSPPGSGREERERTKGQALATAAHLQLR